MWGECIERDSEFLFGIGSNVCGNFVGDAIEFCVSGMCIRSGRRNW